MDLRPVALAWQCPSVEHWLRHSVARRRDI